MKRILWGSFLVLLLAACGTTKPDLPQATGTFSFTVDPSAQSVKLAAAPGGALTAQAEDGSRVLVPSMDLSLEDYTFAFLPGNLLAIDASFKNISGKTLKNLTFARAAGSSGVVSSTEPDVVERLEAGVYSGAMRFTVQHRGQRFTYEVEASATVEEPGEVECTDPINIPDRDLREGIRIQLELPEGSEITCADIKKLTELDFSELRFEIDPENPELVDVRSLEGLQFAVNLRSLSVPVFSQDRNLVQPLSELTNLTNLRIGYSSSAQDNIDVPEEFENFYDLSYLGNLTNLTSLTISLYHTDYSWIRGLTKLTKLNLFYNELIEDLSFFSALPNLTALDLTDNRISDVSPLVANESLGDNDDVINLSQNCLDLSAGSQASQDIATVENRNPNVQNVFVESQKSNEVCGQQPPPPPAEDCTDPVNIPDAVLVDAIRAALQKPEGDITCADLASLTELRVFGADITGDFLTYAKNFEGLQFATNLTYLGISGDNFLEGVLNPIADLTKLTELYLFSQSTQNPDLSALNNLTNLRKFRLSTNPEGSDYNGPLELDDLNALGNLTELTEVQLLDVAATNIAPLGKLVNLKTLIISNAYGDGTLSDLEPLASLAKLETLKLPSNKVRDLKPLSGLTNLTQLDLAANLVLDLTPLVQNEQLGDDGDVIVLYQNCLKKDATIEHRARADINVLEGRNPAVNNVYVDLDNPDDYNPTCDYR